MTLDEYQKEAIKTAIYKDNAKHFYPLFALFEEVGEVTEKVANKITATGCLSVTKNMEDIIKYGKEIAGLAKTIRKENNEYINSQVDIAFNNLNANMDKETLDAISKECGDCLWQISAIATGFGLSLETIAKQNIDKLKDRQQRNTLDGNGDNR